MDRYKLDPTLARLGKRLDSILWDIAQLPLSPPLEELLQRLRSAEREQDAPRMQRASPIADHVSPCRSP